MVCKYILTVLPFFLFFFLTVSFEEQKLFVDDVQCISFSFKAHAFCHLCKESLPRSRSPRFSFMLSSRSFIMLAFPLGLLLSFV